MESRQILTALEEQLRCYKRLAKLAQQQHEYVKQSQTEQLLEVLARRQVELEQIAELEKTISPAKRAWSKFLPTLSAADAERAQMLLNHVRELLAQITESDKDDALVLQQRKINVGRQLGKAAIGQKVTQSYAAAAYGKRSSTMDITR